MPQLSYRETPDKGVSGQIADTRNYRSSTGLNTTNAAVKPGTFVTRAFTTAGREKEIKPPASAADITGGNARGFVIHQDLHINPLVITNVDRASYQPTEELPVMEQGFMFVRCETAWTAGANVYVRFTAKGGNTELGAVRNDADPTAAPADTAALCQFARFEDTGSGAGIAKISFDIRPATA